MSFIALEDKDINNFIMIGDKVLIKPTTPQHKTKSGLYLPPNVQEKESILSGYVIKAGPGYPVPAIEDHDEPWKNTGEDVKYVPLQARSGDLAIYLQAQSFEIEYNNEKYHILSHSAILMLIRDKDLFK